MVAEEENETTERESPEEEGELRSLKRELAFAQDKVRKARDISEERYWRQVIKDLTMKIRLKEMQSN